MHSAKINLKASILSKHFQKLSMSFLKHLNLSMVLQCSANLLALKFANVIISKVDSIFLNVTTSNQIFTFFNKKLKECNMYKSDSIFLNVTTSNQICTFFNKKLKNAICTKVVLQTQLKPSIKLAIKILSFTLSEIE